MKVRMRKGDSVGSLQGINEMLGNDSGEDNHGLSWSISL